MIQYTVLPEQRTIVATIKGTEFDAMKKIDKIVAGTPFEDVYHDKYLMPYKFSVRLICDPSDEFDEKEGKKLARKKLMKNYYRSLDKRMAAFVADVLALRDKIVGDK